MVYPITILDMELIPVYATAIACGT